MKSAIEGSVKRIVYMNDDNSYCVLAFESNQGPVTAAGVLPGAAVGRRYQLEGEWQNHPKYGEQFAFSSFAELMPDTEDSIAAFLSSGIIKGVGPVLAATIVYKFGDKTLDIIANHPEKLKTVPGIGKAKAKAITEGYREHMGYADTVMALSPFGIKPSVCMRLYKKYGLSTVDIIKEDPYRLIEDIDGFGFDKTDKIARSMGIPADSSSRICWGIRAALQAVTGEGNTFAYEDEFLLDTAAILDVSRESISEEIYNLVMSGILIKENLDGRITVCFRNLYDAERSVASRLYLLSQAPLKHISGNAENMIRKTELETGISLSALQKEAVIMAVQNGVSVITGGPGTGKTTIINTILAILENAGVRTLLSAPTGRAAKRMSQATDRIASTVHRMLDAQYSESEKTMYFAKNEENPLDADCVIVDEMSMVDISLMSALLKAMKLGTRLILVGDADQLPSVGPGNVLKDIIESETIHCTKLTEIFRQAAESDIIINAHAVNRGEYPVCNRKDTDFFLIQRDNMGDVLAEIKELCKTRLPAYYRPENPLMGIQVLAPTKIDMVGTVNLNKELQAVLNPPKPGTPEFVFDKKVFRLGDKVIQTKNDYNLEWTDLKDFEVSQGVFNGDMGIVHSIDNDGGSLSVLYDDDRLVTYDFSTIDEIDLAYALTVHKSQGCEFPLVVMPVAMFMKKLTNRNLFYTAITRAKTAVVLVGKMEIAYGMVDNNTIKIRNSGLAHRLRKIWDTIYE